MDRKILVGGMLAVATFMAASTASAALSVRVSTDGGVTYTDFLDANNDGKIDQSGISYNGWDIDLTAKGEVYYDAFDPAGSVERMHYDSVDVTGLNALADLTLMFTETDLMKNPAGFTVGYGGFTNSGVSFQSYVSASNTAFDTSGTLVDDSGLLSGLGFSGVGGGALSLISSPYVWTTVATIVLGNPGDTTSFNYDVKIPEPGTTALLGLGLLGMGFAARRRRKG